MNLLRRTGLGLVGVLAIAAGCSAPDSGQAVETETTAKTERQALTQTIPFDFDNGNSAAEVIIPTIAPLLLDIVTDADASILLHVITTATAAWFDAVAPYTPKTIGFYSRIPRRPASESATNRNMNIAILYANYRTLIVTMPRHTTQLRAMMTGLGLDPDNNSTNLTTAVGIGNVAGNSVIAERIHDGMNLLGDAGSKKYHRRPYEDTTGYEPVNTALTLKDPSRYQPDIVTANNGIFRIQQGVTPQYGKAEPFVVTNVNQLVSFPPPRNSDWRERPAAYRAQAQEVLAASAALTDEKKMEAELFNMKIISLGGVTGFAAASHGLSLADFIAYDHMVLAAAFDAGIATWKGKYRYDAVRPFSAIHFLYANKKVTSWGGVGKGRVTDMPGEDWRSYLQTADHPEYPSGSSCFCAAHAEASRRYFGNDTLGWNVPRPKGSSVIEPGITPATDIVLSYPTWTEFETRCGFSRLHAGVHFRSAIEEAREGCSVVGAKAHEIVMKHVRGDVH
jgi:hypothetical protein